MARRKLFWASFSSFKMLTDIDIAKNASVKQQICLVRVNTQPVEVLLEPAACFPLFLPTDFRFFRFCAVFPENGQCLEMQCLSLCFYLPGAFSRQLTAFHKRIFTKIFRDAGSGLPFAYNKKTDLFGLWASRAFHSTHTSSRKPSSAHFRHSACNISARALSMEKA